MKAADISAQISALCLEPCVVGNMPPQKKGSAAKQKAAAAAAAAKRPRTKGDDLTAEQKKVRRDLFSWMNYSGKDEEENQTKEAAKQTWLAIPDQDRGQFLLKWKQAPNKKNSEWLKDYTEDLQHTSSKKTATDTGLYTRLCYMRTYTSHLMDVNHLCDDSAVLIPGFSLLYLYQMVLHLRVCCHQIHIKATDPVLPRLLVGHVQGHQGGCRSRGRVDRPEPCSLSQLAH